MQATRKLLHQPMIKFLGKRTIPTSIDHSPRVHPASPVNSLPNSFAAYRQKAQQHGPLNLSSIGGSTGASLGPVEPQSGVYFDRNQLGERFRRIQWTQAEIEAVESGGASMFA